MKTNGSRGSTKSDRRSSVDLSFAFSRDLKLNHEHVAHLAKQLWEELDTPTSLGLFLCLQYGDWASVVNHDIDPSQRLTADDAAIDLQAVKFLSKCDGLPTGIDTRAAAAETLLACEKSNSQMNEFWREYDCGRLELTKGMNTIMWSAREIIAQILGPLDVAAVESFCRLGPGVTAFGSESNIDYHKLSFDPVVTVEAQHIAAALVTSYWGWYDCQTYGGYSPLKVKTVKGGKYTTVPKSSKTDRNIETQPSVNLFLQLAFGHVLRDKLKVYGINLDDQTLNQAAAWRGSKDGSLATIDLSNASDMISTGTVAALLPSDWYAALNMIRTRRMFRDGEWSLLHRFSSMGNGFSFELETLLFYAISRAVCGSSATVLVYGDDIVVPSQYYVRVCHALELFGFRVNRRKSYGSGPFRESCGKDYFNGILVRPYYLKGVPSNVSEVIRVVNGLSRAARRRCCNSGVDRRFRRVLLSAHSLIPHSLRKLIAVGWPDDDSFLCGSRYKEGVRLTLVTPGVPGTGWYPGKCTVLYRLHTRYIKRRDADAARLPRFLIRPLTLGGRVWDLKTLRLWSAAPENQVSDGHSYGSSRQLLLPSRGEVRRALKQGSNLSLETVNPERVDRTWGLEGPPWLGFL